MISGAFIEGSFHPDNYKNKRTEYEKSTFLRCNRGFDDAGSMPG